MNSLDNIPRIKAFIFDIDGVLTNGVVGYTGSSTVKYFSIQDGHVMKMAMRLGYIVGMLSGRDDAANRQRAEELQLSFYHGGAKTKLTVFEEILRTFSIAAEECLYVGDDVIDIPVIKRCGLGVCVANAVPEVRACAAWQTAAAGGAGAAREVICRILKEQDRWNEAMARYL